jgi:hypothetical protein
MTKRESPCFVSSHFCTHYLMVYWIHTEAIILNPNVSFPSRITRFSHFHDRLAGLIPLQSDSDNQNSVSPTENMSEIIFESHRLICYYC